MLLLVSCHIVHSLPFFNQGLLWPQKVFTRAGLILPVLRFLEDFALVAVLGEVGAILRGQVISYVYVGVL